MASRPKGYGFSAEINKKLEGKYSDTEEKEVLSWISQTISEDLSDVSGPNAVREVLKDGVILCKLINTIQPGSVKKINTSKLAFKQMENIGNFLDCCSEYGVAKTDMFQTVNLYEGTNMAQVLMGISALGRAVGKKGGQGIGPKESTKNERNFTDEQLNAGKGVIGLQMGSNKGASQAGQSFGRPRDILN